MRQLGAAEDYPTRVQPLASLRDSPYLDLGKKMVSSTHKHRVSENDACQKR